jgi:hypothetical protein
LIGVGVDLALILLFIVLSVVYYIRSYHGTCPNPLTLETKPCSLSQHLWFSFIIILVVVYVGRWLILFIGIVPPMVGLIVGFVFRDYERA